MVDIFELLKGQKDQNGDYQKQPVIVQGITGKFGSVHTKLMLEYGTNIAAGVTPGKGGQKFENVPIYENMKDAVDATDAKISIMFVPAKFFLDAAKEALEAGIKLLVQQNQTFLFLCLLTSLLIFVILHPLILHKLVCQSIYYHKL